MKNSLLGKSTERIKLKVESAEVLRNQSFAMAQREMKSIFTTLRSRITDSVDHVTSSCHEVHERAHVTLGPETSISPPTPKLYKMLHWINWIVLLSLEPLAGELKYASVVWSAAGAWAGRVSNV